MKRRFISWALAAITGLAVAFSSAADPIKIVVTPAPTNSVAASAAFPTSAVPAQVSASTSTVARVQIARDGEYTSKEDVALYIRTYKGALPRNFITKNAARALGWTGGPLEPYAPGKSIGGDHFGNYEHRLPHLNGGSYKECDIDTKGRPRGSKRLIYTQKGQRIYYTDDHYKTFREVK